jgi:hypothetical protein
MMGFWELVKPLLVARTPQQTGRPRVSDRTAFTAIVFVLVRLGYLGEWSLGRSAVLG